MGSSRDDYIRTLKARLDELNTEIDRIENKVGEVTAEVKARCEAQLEEAKARRDELQDKVAELRRSGDAAWDDLKKGADQARKALGDAVQAAKKHFD